MKNSYLLFRRAFVDEVDTIWDLLHSQSISLDESYINEHIFNFFVLLSNHKILGVLFCSDSTGISVDWIAIHPMYPEKSFKNLMIEQLNSFFIANSTKMNPSMKILSADSGF